MLTDLQQNIVKQIGRQYLSQTRLLAIIDENLAVTDLSDQELFEFCEIANACYRAGVDIITDARYDHVFIAEVIKRDPFHPLVNRIDKEGAVFAGQKLLLPEPMFSTAKAYHLDEVNKWLNKLIQAQQTLNLRDEVIVKVTAKLDGFAAYDDGQKLYTRGDGKRGTDISRVFERGLKVYNHGKRGQGLGEIVVKKSYFEQHLASHFDHARNFQASIIREKSLDQYAKQAVEAGATLFVPFAMLPNWQGNISQLLAEFTTIIEDIKTSVDFYIDGVVLEAVDADIKAYLGSNRHHHRWQLAFKDNKDIAIVSVLSVIPQVGRTGKITPVVELEPTKLSGATIRRATAHHYGMIKAEGIAQGAVIELVRSGLVIPKIVKVLTPATADIPEKCPSCGQAVSWQKDFLYCHNHQHCPAQIIHSMAYFFQTLGNIDGFGLATIEKLYQNQVSSISQIYLLDKSQWLAMGFGDKTSDNLMAQLKQSRQQIIEDWRFLAAFGIERLGLGNAERLLQHYPFAQLFNLTVEQIVAIEGFAELTAKQILSGLASIQSLFQAVFALGFNLDISPLLADVNVNADSNKRVLAGKTVCFTGTMQSGTREQLKKQAKALGANISNRISSRTDYLIVGEKAGASKRQQAQAKNITILSETDYLNLLNS